MKIKKLADLKKWINSLSEEELKQTLSYNSEEFSLSGQVAEILKAKSNYYIDDNDTLRTKSELLKDGYDKEDIDSMIVEFPKGTFYVSF